MLASEPANAIPPTKRYLTVIETEAYTGIPSQTLADYRTNGFGPAFIKLGHRSIRYDRVEIDRWMSQRQCHNSAESVALSRADRGMSFATTEGR